MVAIFGILVWVTTNEHDSIILSILLVLGMIAWFRIFAAVVVRASIQISAKSCLEAARQHDGNVLLLGFSWGGAVRNYDTLVLFRGILRFLTCILLDLFFRF